MRMLKSCERPSDIYRNMLKERARCRSEVQRCLSELCTQVSDSDRDGLRAGIRDWVGEELLITYEFKDTVLRKAGR